MTVLIGLTGGIGTGKSTVSRMLEELGVKVIDADRVCRELMEPGQSVYDKVVEHFGPYILKLDKTIDRTALGRVVFNDKAQLEMLERMTHPSIVAEMDRRYAQYSEQGECIVVFEVPLLIEKNMQHVVDEIWLVVCKPETQISRVVARGLSEEEAKARIAVQIPLPQKLKYADRVIDTDGTLAFTHEQVMRHWGAVCGCKTDV